MRFKLDFAEREGMFIICAIMIYFTEQLVALNNFIIDDVELNLSNHEYAGTLIGPFSIAIPFENNFEKF